MTVSITTRRNDYTGNGAVDEYAFSFHINASSELRVTIRDTDGVEELQVLTTDYTVDGVDDVSGGTITLVAGNLTNGYHLTIQGIDPLTQTTDIRNQGSYYPEVIEDTFDHLVKIDQQQQDQIDRCVSLPDTVDDSDFDPTLPSGIVGAANVVPITNDDGDGWASADEWIDGSAISGAAASAAAAAASAAAAAASAAAAATSVGINSPYGINNIGFAASVAANAMTIALKQSDGSTDHSTGAASGFILFRSATAASGSYANRVTTAAVSLVVPSGATLGHNDAIADYVYIYAIDNAGAIELAVSSSSHWDEGQLVSTTAIGTGSDDAATMYSTSARTNVACRLIGRIVSTQTTAGAWATAISRLETRQLFTLDNIVAARAANFIAKHGVIYNVSTSGARTVTIPTPRDGFRFVIADSTGSSETNNITISPTSGTIDGVSGNKLLANNYGVWEFLCDGTNYKTVRSSDVSYTIFEGTGGFTIPTTFASPTLSAATSSSKGLLVNRSSNTLTFPFLGRWVCSFHLSATSSSGGSNNIMARIRNTTTPATASLSTMGIAHITGNGDDHSFKMPFTVTSTSAVHELQWASTGATVNCSASAVDGETGPDWRAEFVWLGR